MDLSLHTYQMGNREKWMGDHSVMGYSAYTKISQLLLPHISPTTSPKRNWTSQLAEKLWEPTPNKVNFMLSPSSSPFKAPGLYYMKAFPPWGGVLGLGCFGNVTYSSCHYWNSLVPIRLCAFWGEDDETETPTGESDLESSGAKAAPA